ncbi:XdhC family protein [Marinobacterium aestuariivivens]|uniref:XdhC family protein n=1 Tax=Marinobacterium aestuariivivens TaxID=1698799 RepID=A0ABW2A5J8_9GAMM
MPRPEMGRSARPATLIREGDQQWLKTAIIPPPHLLLIGGGLDARPLVAMAHELGWQTSLWDPRPANARREHFMQAGLILDETVEALATYSQEQPVDAAVLMTHNIPLDAAALKSLQRAPLRYLALLGPASRRARVLEEAGLSEKTLDLPLAGPAGLDIGGELPESIALSILSECHAVLFQHSARPLNRSF